MREFGVDNLYRVSVEADSVWSKYYLKKLKPYYVVAENENNAKQYIEQFLRNGLKIKKVIKLAEQYGNNLFGSNP